MLPYCCYATLLLLCYPIVARGIRDDIEGEDDHESYFNAVANAIILADEDDEEWEYDEDGNPIPPERSKVRIIYICKFIHQSKLK